MTNEIKESQTLAFPHSRLGSDCDGMSLRDYFASKVMQGLCANPRQLVVMWLEVSW